MAFSSIANLKDTLGLGARANLFEVSLAFPIGVTGNASDAWNGPDQTLITATNVNILVKAAQVPAFTIGTIEVPYKAGRRIKIPGDRTFADWTVTVINDENHVARRAFTAWINMISKGNYNSATKSSVKNYYRDLTVTQLKGSGNTVRVYKLIDAFPTDVSGVDLSMDSTDTLSEFTVNFQYQYLKAGTLAEVNSEKSQVKQSTVVA
jgi:PKD repeat protein